MSEIHYLFGDSETIPAVHWTEEEISAYVKTKAEAAIRYGKIDRIQQVRFEIDERERIFLDSALDPLCGRLLCASFAIGGQEPEAFYAEGYATAKTPEEFDAAELELVLAMERFVDAIPSQVHRARRVRWVGHNLVGFDLRWWFLRALRYKRYEFASRIPYQKWDKRVRDTLELLAGPNPKNQVGKLDDVCQYLGLGRKTVEKGGASVYEMWKQGHHEEIKKYCANDVVMHRDVFREVRRGGYGGG